MPKNRSRVIALISLMFFVCLPALSGCNFRAKKETTPEGDAALTAAAQTIEAQSSQLTIQAQAALLTQQAAAAQQGTAPQEPPPVQTVPPPQQPPAAAPGLPTIVGLMDTNCRAGPSPDYPRLGALLKDQQSTVHGTNSARTWWYIENPKAAGQFCWVWGDTTQVTGDISALQIIEPPPVACAPPYDFKDFSNPTVQWRPDPFGPRVEVNASVYIAVECADVPLKITVIGKDSGGAQVFSGSVQTTTNSKGKATFTFLSDPLTTMPGVPVQLSITWEFASSDLGTASVNIKADVPPTP